MERPYPKVFTGNARILPGWIALSLAMILNAPCTSWGEQPVGAQQDVQASNAGAELAVAATIAGEPIYVAEVEQRVNQSLGGRAVTSDLRVGLQAEALELLIDRRRALASLRELGEAADDREVDVEIERLKGELSRQEKTLDEHCRSQGIQPLILRQQLRWQRSWRRYLAKHLTEDNLRRYFDRHRREFDGTTMRVAQVLLKHVSSEGSAAVPPEELLARARRIRQEIVAGKITFAQAARKYSEAPSAESGGQLDWIGRDGPMPESFSRVAFALEVGETSEPLISSYGVHLIGCLEIKPGEGTWENVRGKLTDAMSEYLFRWLVQRAPAGQEVQYIDTVPHFLPGTRQLAVPPSQSGDSAPSGSEQVQK